jgi:hypothetical protein
LTFAAKEDGNLKMLPPGPGPGPERLVLVYGQTPCFLAISSTSGSACSGLDPYTGLYIHTTKLIRGISIVTSILQPSARAMRSSTSATSPNQDSVDDYPEIRGSTCGHSTRRVALSSWWPRPEDLLTIVPANVPPSGDQNHPMLGRPMIE